MIVASRHRGGTGVLCGYADLMMEKLIPVRRTSCRILAPYSFAIRILDILSPCVLKISPIIWRIAKYYLSLHRERYICMNKDECITLLKKYMNILKEKYGITSLSLFGSTARGEDAY